MGYGHHWDLMIAHPPCTYLSVSSMHWTARGKRDPQLTGAPMHVRFKLECVDLVLAKSKGLGKLPDQLAQLCIEDTEVELNTDALGKCHSFCSTSTKELGSFEYTRA